MKVQLYKGDCLEQMKNIPDGSVDLILTDPPYGNMDTDGGRKLGISKWDRAISPEHIFLEAKRILRKNGRLILFSQEPYSNSLIYSAIPAIPFSYRMIWEKDNFANALGVNKAPVSFFEDILVFNKPNIKHDFEGRHPLREYSKNVLDYIGETKKKIIERVGGKADHFFRFNSSQFELCTKEVYNELTQVYFLDLMEEYTSYEDLENINIEFKNELITKMTEENPVTFNLPEGKKYKSNILKYKKDYTGLHPTQKPVALMEDLILTFSNPDDTILDFTMGSGSTGVAALNKQRNFIGIEMDDKHFATAENRINTTYKNLLY